ncbi:MAG: hypothetical protein GY724_18880 [Actinomycetia bacterium]|nr:hypothetical protein [Actinomycetes bacterium]
MTGPPESYATSHERHTLLLDGRHLVATETLRFRSEGEILSSLGEAGFDIKTTWGDWDRSSARLELIVLAKRH